MLLETLVFKAGYPADVSSQMYKSTCFLGNLPLSFQFAFFYEASSHECFLNFILSLPLLSGAWDQILPFVSN